MISKEKVLEVIKEKIEEDECFVVDIKVSIGNKITVLIDSFQGISIDYCIKISRFIEGAFDRDEEDYELEVSTPGLGQAFKVLKQYKKNVGKEVEVNPLEGVPFKGVLMEVTEEGFTVEESKKVKIKGEKKKELQVFKYNYKFNDVKSVKLIISF